MRLILMFDIPNNDDEDRIIYTKFRREVLRLGYTMIQYSVYVKCVNTQSKVEQEVEKIKKIIPFQGNIRIISITEKQYHNSFILRGKRKINEIYNNDKRYIKI